MINLRFKPQFASILLLSLFVLACTSSEESHIQDEAGSCLSDAMVERVSIDEVTQLQAHQSLVLPGQVVVNQDRVFRVYPAAGGIISDVHVRLGDRVHKGQRLATVQSPDIAEFQRDKRSAIAEKSLAERSLSLARSLYESGVNSERDLQEAKNNLERAESELERLHEMQRTLGVEEGQSTYIIRAPEAGFVVERNINPGLRLRAGDDHVFEISDLTDVWVVANVSENDIRNVRTQNEVSISMVAYPDHNFTGEIVRLSSALDPNRRTLEAIIELPNP
ncbi:MAG: efflux RND transporter periplasmic adaptor subunit, partial [Balneolales bacterium]|nr:efflux RND transporter periplasmic adaptor subunit [Balneolales bacterium]